MKSHTPIHTKQNPLRSHAITTLGFFLIENHRLRAIMMIQKFTSRCQGQSYTLSGVYEVNSLSGSTSVCEKNSYKKYDPFPPMAITWFIETSVNMNSHPYIMLNTTHKNILSSYVLKTTSFYDLRLMLKNLSQRLSWKSQFPFLLHLKAINVF